MNKNPSLSSETLVNNNNYALIISGDALIHGMAKKEYSDLVFLKLLLKNKI